jgi:hypothetical protein
MAGIQEKEITPITWRGELISWYSRDRVEDAKLKLGLSEISG